jgi:hypothetical protein
MCYRRGKDVPPEEAAALIRRLRTTIWVERSGGFPVDFGDPGYRELSDSPDLIAISADELERRVGLLIKPAGELPC